MIFREMLQVKYELDINVLNFENLFTFILVSLQMWLVTIKSIFHILDHIKLL